MNIHNEHPYNAQQKPHRQTYLLCKSNGLAAQLVSSLRNLRQIFAHDVCISFHVRLVTVEPNLKVHKVGNCVLKRLRSSLDAST